MVQSLALAWLTLSHRVNIKEVRGAECDAGLHQRVRHARPAVVHGEDGEDRADLSNAIAINSSMVNVARLIGPSLAGLLIAATNEGWCFLVDGVSYIAVIASLVMMRLPAATMERATTTMLAQLREGWTYVADSGPHPHHPDAVCAHQPDGLAVHGADAVFAAQVLHGGPHTLGFLMGAVGVGSLVLH